MPNEALASTSRARRNRLSRIQLEHRILDTVLHTLGCETTGIHVIPDTDSLGVCQVLEHCEALIPAVGLFVRNEYFPLACSIQQWGCNFAR
jgi:hypothetical protein